MITIQSIMLIVFGFLCTALAVLLLAPAFWRRAVRLTSQRLKDQLPISEVEIRAGQDRIRAEYAVRVHRLETQVKESKLASTRRLIEINRRDASISKLETDLERMKASLEENQNARRVLDQTVADRLPKVEKRLAETKQHLYQRDQEIGHLNDRARLQRQALEEATSINEQQTADIERLNLTLATRSANRNAVARNAGFEIEVALRSELEALRAKSRDQSGLISRLQGQLGAQSAALSQQAGSTPAGALEGVVNLANAKQNALDIEMQRGASSGTANKNAGAGVAEQSVQAMKVSNVNAAMQASALESQMQQLRRELNETKHELKAAQTGAGVGAGVEEGDSVALARAQQKLSLANARSQDQANELIRLRAALATYEQAADDKKKASVRDSRIGLKARLNAVSSQVEQQNETIHQLRAELAAAHERWAQLSQQHVQEMRRLGAGTMPAAFSARQTVVKQGGMPSLAAQIAGSATAQEQPNGHHQGRNGSSRTKQRAGQIAHPVAGSDPGKSLSGLQLASGKSSAKALAGSGADGVAAMPNASAMQPPGMPSPAMPAGQGGPNKSARGDNSGTGKQTVERPVSPKVLVKPTLTNGIDGGPKTPTGANKPQKAPAERKRRLSISLLERITGNVKG